MNDREPLQVNVRMGAGRVMWIIWSLFWAAIWFIITLVGIFGKAPGMLALGIIGMLASVSAILLPVGR